MCGRIGNGRDSVHLATELGARWAGEPWRPRWNVAPTQYAPVLRLVGGDLILTNLRWGLCVGWAKERGLKQEPINAQSEKAARKPFFRSAFRQRRCLVPVEGFFEWQARTGGKMPYWIHHPEGELLTFAGLWESWTPPDAEPVHSFTILTTAANEAMRPVHNRMPVILAGADRDAWLDPAATAEVLGSLMRPYAAPLSLYAVSTRVNSPRNDGADLIVPTTD